MYNKDYVSYATKKGDFWEKNSLGWRRRTMMNDETALSTLRPSSVKCEPLRKVYRHFRFRTVD